MTMMADLLPEVKSHHQTGRFFRQGTRDFIEIALVGSKDTLVQKVKPEHMAQFRAEWDAFCDGRPLEQRPGTPLTDLPTISDDRAKDYIHRNVHNLEELAALNDGQCQSMGHGTLTDRKSAIALLMHRTAVMRDKLQKEVQEKSAAIGPVPAETYAGKSEIDAVKSELAELKGMLAQLIEANQPRPRGRPKKAS